MANQPDLIADITGQPQAYRQLVRTGSARWEEALKAMPDEWRRAPRVVLTGMGSSYFASLGVVSAWNRWGLRTTVELSSELLHHGEGRLREGDLLVAVSQSGESAEVVALLQQLEGRGVHVIGVTNNADSTLARLAPVSLVMDVAPDRTVAVKSHGASLLTLLYLGLRLAGLDLDTWYARSGEAILALEYGMAQGEDWRRLGRSLLAKAPGGRPAIAVLARGPLMAAAREGALLFNEVSKLPSWAEDGGEFRHGVVEVGEPGMIAVILVSHDHTSELNLNLIGELLRTGSLVVACVPESLHGAVPQPAGPGELHVLSQPNVAADFAAVAQVLPLQWLSLGLAEGRGLVPGLFRATPAVIRSER
ncbi:MAG: SIS domain-containing protein [Bacillota bacterium]